MGEEVRRENRTLSNEIKDIMDQISEGGRSIHEIDKIRKRLEAEKMELQSALEEAEATLEQEENKVLRCQLELNTVRQEIERRLAEKEEEFILVKKAQSKALDSMQVALVVVSLEGLDDEVVGVVALAGHLLLEHLDHVVVGAGSRDLAQQAVKLRLAHEDTDVVEGTTQVVLVQLAILVDVHQLEAVLVHLELLL